MQEYQQWPHKLINMISSLPLHSLPFNWLCGQIDGLTPVKLDDDDFLSKRQQHRMGDGVLDINLLSEEEIEQQLSVYLVPDAPFKESSNSSSSVRRAEATLPRNLVLRPTQASGQPNNVSILFLILEFSLEYLRWKYFLLFYIRETRETECANSTEVLFTNLTVHETEIESPSCVARNEEHTWNDDSRLNRWWQRSWRLRRHLITCLSCQWSKWKNDRRQKEEKVLGIIKR